MSTSLCPECKYEGLTNGSDLCPNCGANWSKKENDDFSFRVSQQTNCEMELGDDDLGIETPEQLLENNASDPKDSYLDEKLESNSHEGTIGSTEPILPEQVETDSANTNLSPIGNTSATSFNDSKSTDHTDNSIPKLSDNELKDIENKLYGNNHQKKTETQEKDITETISSKAPDRPFDSEPIVPPKRDKAEKPKLSDIPDNLPQPKMASRGRGIAYFYKNYIKLVGMQELHADDEMNIAGRAYSLKPKRFN